MSSLSTNIHNPFKHIPKDDKVKLSTYISPQANRDLFIERFPSHGSVTAVLGQFIDMLHDVAINNIEPYAPDAESKLTEILQHYRLNPPCLKRRVPDGTDRAE